MRFDVLTLFPGMIDYIMSESIVGRARQSGLIQVNPINIRDFAGNKYNRIDDYPYGGGSGMVMQPMPIYEAWQSVIGSLDSEQPKPRVIYMSPQGKLLTQELVRELSEEKHLILLCGHYEGVDERIIEEIVTDEVSIGDYVLTGGELPAAVLMDAVARMIPGVLAGEESFTEESIYGGLLEYPQYTRPPEFKGRVVPEILLSGHHANIAKWRKKQSLLRTYKKRPDLLEKRELDKTESKLLKEVLAKLEDK